MSLLKNLLTLAREGAAIKAAEPNVWGSRPGNVGLWRNPFSWQPGSRFDYEGEAGDLWLNGCVMMALRFKACAITEMRPVVQEWDPQKRAFREAAPTPDVRDWLRAFTEPTEDYDWTVMLGSVFLSDDVAGNAFLIKRKDGLDRPRAGYRYEPHFLMEAVSDDPKRLVTGYRYGAPGDTLRPLPREDVVHIRQLFLNPRERRLGMTPLAAVLRDVCADNELTNWLASLLRNGAMPSHLLVPKSTGDDRANQAAAALWSKTKGNLGDLFKQFVKDMRGEAMTAPMPMEAIKLMWSPAELEIAELQQGPVARIFAAQGVDPMCVGLPSANKTYSNFEEARDGCGKMTIIPTAGRWMGQFSRQTAPDFGLDPQRYRMWLATDGVSWLQDETADLHDRVRKDFVSNVIDLHDAYEEIGRKPEEWMKGVRAFMLKQPAAAPAAADPEGKTLDRIRRTHVAMKALGL